MRFSFPLSLISFICCWQKGFAIGKHPSIRKQRSVVIKPTDQKFFSPFHSSDDTKKVLIADVCRGGACSDSTPSLFVKIGISAGVETFLMANVLFLAIRSKFGFENQSVATLVQLTLILSVIFGSSSFGALADTGVSAASKQILAPNEVPGDPVWYANLKKPKWNPPGWLFPIMWLIISKPTQLIAVRKIVKACPGIGDLNTRFAFLVYCAHLSLGDAWNKVFFGLQCPGRGVAIIITFWSLLWTSAYLFYQIEPSAGLFLLPTCLWVTVASALNISIYNLNKA
jgi:tryptophan-rich sensory protein